MSLDDREAVLLAQFAVETPVGLQYVGQFNACRTFFGERDDGWRTEVTYPFHSGQVRNLVREGARTIGRIGIKGACGNSEVRGIRARKKRWVRRLGASSTGE